MGKVSELIMGHQAAVLGSASVLLAAGVAWGLSTQPLVPREGAVGSAGSSISAAAMGSTAGPAPSGNVGSGQEPSDDRAAQVGKAEGGGESEADAGPGDAPAAKSPSRESSPGNGADQAQNQKPAAGAPAQRPSRPSAGGQAQSQTPPKPGGGSSSGPAPSNPAPQQPQHSHSFQPVYRDEPVYEQQWVPNMVEVYKGRQERYVCNQCGATLYSGTDLDAHFYNSYISGGKCGTYVDDSYDIWEKEDHGSYQQVQTGTKQVLDHYECPCGAVK